MGEVLAELRRRKLNGELDGRDSELAAARELIGAMIRWDAPGPYEVVFTTRDGGVSEGPFASLNLGRATGDDAGAGRREPPARSAPRSAREPDALAMNYQRHSADVPRARPGARGEPRRRALDRRAAACRCSRSAPTACRSRSRAPNGARARGRGPARGLARAARRASLEPASRRSAAGSSPPSIGPAIGPCCYEVGEEVAEPFRARVRARDRPRRQARPVARGRARAARGRRASASSASTSAPRATRTCSSRIAATGPHRPPGGARALSPDDGPRALRADPRRGRAGRDVVAATKYVSVEDMAVAGRGRGRGRRREPRAGPRGASTPRYGDAFRWHFIGHLQSRKAKIVNAICELVPLARLGVGGAAPRRSPRSSRSTSPARRRSRASRPSELDDFLAALPDVRGPDDDAAARPTTPRRRARTSAGCASSPSEHGLRELSMGTSQDYRVAVEEGATLRASGLRSCYRRVTFREPWASPTSGTARSSTSASPRRTTTGTRTATLTDEELERTLQRAAERAPAHAAAAGRQEFDDWTDPEPARRRRATAVCARAAQPRAGRTARPRRRCAPCRRVRCTSSSRAASTTRSRSRTSSRTGSR